MECDSDHRIIEKKKKTFSGTIEHPLDWAKSMCEVAKKNPFKVTEMTRADFFNYSNRLKGPLPLKKIDTDGNKFVWRDVKWLQFNKHKPGIVKFKRTLDETTAF
jgi:hypothetical protein